MSARFETYDDAHAAASERISAELEKIGRAFLRAQADENSDGWAKVGDLQCVAQKLEEISRFWGIK